MTLNVLAISGSLRKNSPNTGLLRFAKDNAPEGVKIDIATLENIPFFNPDNPVKTPEVSAFLAKLAQADAFVIATPEYNYSFTAVLKNALDWASREAEQPFANKPVSLISAGGAMGGLRAQLQLRQVLVYLNAKTINHPEVAINAFTGKFNETGDLIDDEAQAMVIKNIEALRLETGDGRPETA